MRQLVRVGHFAVASVSEYWGSDRLFELSIEPVQIQHIRYFLAVANKRDFTTAARACSVAQPSLSNGIRDLECSLGAPLFYRKQGKRGASLTELGEAVRPDFVRIIRSVIKAEQSAARYRAGFSTSALLPSNSRTIPPTS